MTAFTHPLGTAARGRAQTRIAALLQRAWCALRAAAARVARRRRLASMHATLAAMDEATLRDLGLRRADAAAYWAESEGLRPARHAHVVVRRVSTGYRPYPRPVAP